MLQQPLSILRGHVHSIYSRPHKMSKTAILCVCCRVSLELPQKPSYTEDINMNTTVSHLSPPPRNHPRRSSWRAGRGADGSRGDDIFMSPISFTACSPRATPGSPRSGLASPRRALSTTLQRGVAAGGDGGGRGGRGAESLEWWNELELSPSRVDMPGLQQWRCV